MVEEGKGGNICAIPIKSLVSAGRVLHKATANHSNNTGINFKLVEQSRNRIVINKF
jgi:hypothetical protein